MKRRFANRLWLCPVLSLVLIMTVLVLLGITWWTALAVAMLLACPIAFVWTVMEARWSRRTSDHSA